MSEFSIDIFSIFFREKQWIILHLHDSTKIKFFEQFQILIFIPIENKKQIYEQVRITTTIRHTFVRYASASRHHRDLIKAPRWIKSWEKYFFKFYHNLLNVKPRPRERHAELPPTSISVQKNSPQRSAMFWNLPMPKKNLIFSIFFSFNKILISSFLDFEPDSETLITDNR